MLPAPVPDNLRFSARDTPYSTTYQSLDEDRISLISASRYRLFNFPFLERKQRRLRRGRRRAAHLTRQNFRFKPCQHGFDTSLLISPSRLPYLRYLRGRTTVARQTTLHPTSWRRPARQPSTLFRMGGVSLSYSFNFPNSMADIAVEVIREKVQDGITGETRDLQYTQCKIVGNGSFGVVFQNEALTIERGCGHQACTPG